MKNNGLTAELFFQKYVRNKEELKELEYRLARLKEASVQTTHYRHDKVQTSVNNHADKHIYDRKERIRELEVKIQWVKLDINSAEIAMGQVGDGDRYRISFLKRRYLDKYSYNKIATNYGVSDSKVKRIMKETEELLCYIAR